MSYCRFSSDNFKSDVYVYESDDGFVIHTAGNRFVDDLPPVPAFGTVPNEVWLEAHRAQSSAVKVAKRERIDHPEAGEVFLLSDAESCLSKLLELRDAGFHVPDRAVEALREESTEDYA